MVPADEKQKTKERKCECKNTECTPGRWGSTKSIPIGNVGAASLFEAQRGSVVEMRRRTLEELLQDKPQNTKKVRANGEPCKTARAMGTDVAGWFVKSALQADTTSW